MDPSTYWIGVILAITSGVVNNFGTVLMKIVINKHRDDEEFTKNLIKSPLWLTGILMQYIVGTAFFMIAQVYIGPALIPGLMAGGLIVLAIASVKIVGESLKTPEIVGIFIMILGVTLLGLSELSIETDDVNFVESFFIIRTAIYSVSLFVICVISVQFQKNSGKFNGILLALASGYMLSLSNFWIYPLIGVIGNIFGGSFVWGELIVFIVACVILILTNLWAIKYTNDALKFGQASNLIPIQQVPIQITPMLIYYLVFLLLAPSVLSIFFSIIAVALIIWSSFLLGKRQAQLEEITTDKINIVDES